MKRYMTTFFIATWKHLFLLFTVHTGSPNFCYPMDLPLPISKQKANLAKTFFYYINRVYDGKLGIFVCFYFFFNSFFE